MICSKIGRDPRAFVLVEDLPQRMTLTKYPDLSVQERITGYYPRIGIEEGVERMIEKVRSRL
jgi:nucleoside-diphosphate-sugar epimerase